MRLGILAVVVSMVAACGFSGPSNEGADAPLADAPSGQVTVAFALADSTTDETAGTHVVHVTLSGAPSAAVTVNYKVVGGTATPNLDFKLDNGVVTFAAGTTDATITAQILQDTIDEPDELFTIALDSPDGATLGQPSQHHVTISANTIPRINFAVGSMGLSETVTSPSISVSVDKTSTIPIMVGYKVVTASTTASAADYTLADGTLTISAGTLGGIIPLVIINDALDEDDEQIVVQLQNPVNAELGTTTLFTYTIQDEDPPPSVQFAAATTSFSEAAGLTSVSVALSVPSGKTITVPYTVTLGTASAADVAVSNGTLTFAPGDTTKAIPIAIIQDTLDEDDETFTLALGAPTNATLGTNVSDVVTIVDDDPTPTVSITTASGSAPESAGTVNLTVALSAASSKTITVSFAASGTATGNVDFSYAPLVQTLTFAPGALTQTIAINIVQDAIDEPDETVITTLFSPTNATVAGSPHTLTILDDDPTCFGPPGNYQVCLTNMPSAPVALPNTINTDNSALCATTQPMGWTMNQAAACFVVGTDITQSGTTKVTGSRPLVLVAAGTLTISGTLDASSRQGGSAGPANNLGCGAYSVVPQSSLIGGGGGAGGSFRTAGGNGGGGNGGNSNPGQSLGSDPFAPTVLRGGCDAQRGATGSVGSNAGSFGRGGGSVYLLSGGAIDLSGGVIDASGSGGVGGDADTGGSGGGAGGMIELFATTTLTTTAATTLFANGGGGSGGADATSTGGSGADPTAAAITTAAPGGSGGGGGNGGSGFAGTTQASNGKQGGGGKGGGGGGGGGGYIQSNQLLGSAAFSAGVIDQ